jgi:hypothetical protein
MAEDHSKRAPTMAVAGNWTLTTGKMMLEQGVESHLLISNEDNQALGAMGVNLAGNAGNMLATCWPRVEVLPILGRHA